MMVHCSINCAILASSSRSRSVQELVLIEIELDGCREYDHFSKDCPTTQVEKEAEQIQQMYNMDEEQTALKVLATDTFENLNRINSVDETIVGHLNL